MSLCFPSADGSAHLAATLGRSAEHFALEVIRSRSSASLLKGHGQAWIQARICASLMGTCLCFWSPTAENRSNVEIIARTRRDFAGAGARRNAAIWRRFHEDLNARASGQKTSEGGVLII